jgi:hypothetical protein
MKSRDIHQLGVKLAGSPHLLAFGVAKLEAAGVIEHGRVRIGVELFRDEADSS